MQWENLKWELANEYSYKSKGILGPWKRDCQFYYGIADGKRVVKKEYTSEREVYTGRLSEKLSFESMKEEFEKEFRIMTDIEKDIYDKVNLYPFPHYYACNVGNHPCVIMENIEPPYEPLERRLQKNTVNNCSNTNTWRFQEQCVFGSKNLLKIISQLDSIIRLLYEHGILYIDLQPENILIDDTYNLKLVDFTWCFNIKSYRRSLDNYRNYKIPEDRKVFLEETEPAILICRAFGHFIARLHYRNTSFYNYYFDEADQANFIRTYPGIFGDLIPQGDTDHMLEALKNLRQNNPDCTDLILYEIAYDKLKEQLENNINKTKL